MTAPVWLKLLVIAWLPTTFGLLWFAYQKELVPYLGEHDSRYLESQYVEARWQSWINTVKYSSAVTELGDRLDSQAVHVFHLYSSGCHCNYRAERHLDEISSIPNIVIHRINVEKLPIKPPSSPTLIVQAQSKLQYFGVYGSGLLCTNDGLVDWLSSLANNFSKGQLDEVPFVLNTMARGCFCALS